ncbi:MAG: penicillin-binding protein 2 [Blastochloris sp.]|nr:penicillin-binding protein 2 [Blastochloris sp.]
MNTALQTRAMAIFVLFACGFTVISSRLVYLQLVKSDEYREKAIQMHYRVVPMLAQRGRILDSGGGILSQTVSVKDLRIDGQIALQNPQEVAQIAEVLGWSLADLQLRLSASNRYMLLAEELNPEVAERLDKLKAKSVLLPQRFKRSYPNGVEASHVVGYTNSIRKEVGDSGKMVDFEKGALGIELVMDKYLAGISGERRIVKNNRNREIAAYRQMDREPRDGMDVMLTINRSVQHEIEVEAERIYNDYSANAVNILVVRIGTGEILGMTNRPTFDPNDRKTFKNPENLRNRTIMDQIEPGSTFKIITLAAALNENLVTTETPIFCENGRFPYGGHTLTDTSPHGTLPLWEAFMVSSNIAFAKVGLSLGENKLYKYARLMGFGELAQNPNQALPSEQRGLIRIPQKWSKVDLTRVPIGYGIAVTNLQMSMAVSAIANDGKLMEPRIVKSVLDKDGRIVQEFLPRIVRQVVNMKTAKEVTSVMKHVVEEEGGTGKAARVKDFTAAGKTGTAWKIVNGQYPKGVYYSSFVGFLPADNPEFLVSIVVDEPKARQSGKGNIPYGGKVAAPSFGRIATQVAEELGLQRETGKSVLVDRRRSP